MATLLPFAFLPSSPFCRFFISFSSLSSRYLSLSHALMPVHVEKKRARERWRRGQWHEMKTFKASVIFTEVFNPFRDIIRGRNKIDGTRVPAEWRGDGKRNA